MKEDSSEPVATAFQGVPWPLEPRFRNWPSVAARKSVLAEVGAVARGGWTRWGRP